MNAIEESAIIKDCVKMGYKNYIGDYCVIGCYPVHVPMNKRDELSGVIIGNKNYIYSSSNVVRGIEDYTYIGDKNIIGQMSIIGHDSIINNRVRIMNNVKVNGHVTIGNDTFIGSSTTIRNRIKIGFNCYIGQCSNIVKDIPNNSFGYNIGNKFTLIRQNDSEFINQLKRLKGVFA